MQQETIIIIINCYREVKKFDLSPYQAIQPFLRVIQESDSRVDVPPAFRTSASGGFLFIELYLRCD